MSRDEPEKTTVVTEENSFKSPTKKKATLDQPKHHAIRAASTLADEREELATRKGKMNHNTAVETGRNGKNATVDERRNFYFNRDSDGDSERS